MKYLLDTNAVIGLLGDSRSRLAKAVRRRKPNDIGISAIVVHELSYGAFKSHRATENVAVVEDARCAGEVRAALASRDANRSPRHIDCRRGTVSELGTCNPQRSRIRPGPRSALRGLGIGAALQRLSALVDHPLDDESHSLVLKLSRTLNRHLDLLTGSAIASDFQYQRR